MKRLSLFVAMSLTAGLMFSQDANPFNFGVSFQPQIGKLIIKEGEFLSSDYEFSYTVNGDVYYQLNPRIQLRSGLEWQQAHLYVKDELIMFPMDFINGVWVRGLSYNEYNYTYQFLGIPLNMIFQFGSLEKSNHFFAEGGIKIRNKISESGTGRVVVDGDPHSLNKLEDDQFPKTPNTWFYLNLGFGYKQQVGSLSLTYRPSFEYCATYLNNENLSAGPLNGHPIFFGLSIGILGI